jgi:hypothetical protein
MAAEKTAHLFIGGPWDGRHLIVDSNAPVINAPPREELSFGLLGAEEHGDKHQRVVTYRRAALRAPGREWVVFAADDVDGGDVIGRLIAGYGVANKS